MTLGLLADCVLPGCGIPVAGIGDVCTGCRTAFGDMLQPASGPPLTGDQITARDNTVRSTYQTLHALTG